LVAIVTNENSLTHSTLLAHNGVLFQAWISLLSCVSFGVS